MALTLSNESANAEVDAIAAKLNNGYLRIYSGARPANPDAALSGNTLLAELRFNATAFGAGVNGVATANAITADSSADNTGTATFFRTFKSDGSSPIIDGSVGASGSGADAIINAVAIQQGASVSVTSMTLTAPKT